MIKLNKRRDDAMDSLEFALEMHRKWLDEFQKESNRNSNSTEIIELLENMEGIYRNLRGMQTNTRYHELGPNIKKFAKQIETITKYLQKL